jgi:hypothetical protein
MTERIEASARRAGACVVGRVRDDAAVSRAQVWGRAVVETGAAAADDVRRLWEQLGKEFEEPRPGETEGGERGGPADDRWQPVAERP